MDIREKLVELFDEAARICNKTDCGKCRYFNAQSCVDKLIIDHLIASGVTVQEWIPVSERLPRDERQVLVYFGFGDFRVRYNGILSYYRFDPNPHWQHESSGVVVTHWMPLPRPPKGE